MIFCGRKGVVTMLALLGWAFVAVPPAMACRTRVIHPTPEGVDRWAIESAEAVVAIGVVSKMTPDWDVLRIDVSVTQPLSGDAASVMLAPSPGNFHTCQARPLVLSRGGTVNIGDAVLAIARRDHILVDIIPLGSARATDLLAGLPPIDTEAQ